MKKRDTKRLNGNGWYTFKLYFFEQNFFSRVFRTNFENKFENRNKKKKRERMIEYYLRFVEQRFNDRIDGNAKRLNGSW